MEKYSGLGSEESMAFNFMDSVGGVTGVRKYFLKYPADRLKKDLKNKFPEMNEQMLREVERILEGYVQDS